MSMNLLAEYLQVNGILLCNANPDLPALEDIGCSWQDATDLIQAHGLFYSKAFKKRTTYLSPEAYYLLKAVKGQKELTEPANRIYRILEENPVADTAFLKRAAGLSPKEYQRGFDSLLQNLYVTALQNGAQLNDNWSTFYYGTSSAWEQNSPNVYDCSCARDRLWEMVSSTMSEKQFQWWIR